MKCRRCGVRTSHAEGERIISIVQHQREEETQLLRISSDSACLRLTLRRVKEPGGQQSACRIDPIVQQLASPSMSICQASRT
jgi:hypothetical protein